MFRRRRVRPPFLFDDCVNGGSESSDAEVKFRSRKFTVGWSWKNVHNVKKRS